MLVISLCVVFVLYLGMVIVDIFIGICLLDNILDEVFVVIFVLYDIYNLYMVIKNILLIFMIKNSLK